MHIGEKKINVIIVTKMLEFVLNHFFPHGQFYVACSRVQSGKDLKIWILNAKDLAYTDNVVYPEILK